MKKQLIQQILTLLEAELESLTVSAKVAAGVATHEESRPENKYDTRGLEASYLAGAQAARISELQSAIALLSSMKILNFNNSDPIQPTALVEVAHQDCRTLYFLVTVGAGFSLLLGDRPVVSVTTSSPIGRALLSKTEGDTFKVKTSQGTKEYEIIGVS